MPDQSSNRSFNNNNNNNDKSALSRVPTHYESNVFNFNSEDKAKELKNAKVREYQEELERQLNEKRLQKQKEKEEQDRYKRPRINRIYYPFATYYD